MIMRKNEGARLEIVIAVCPGKVTAAVRAARVAKAIARVGVPMREAAAALATLARAGSRLQAGALQAFRASVRALLAPYRRRGPWFPPRRRRRERVVLPPAPFLSRRQHRARSGLRGRRGSRS